MARFLCSMTLVTSNRSRGTEIVVSGPLLVSSEIIHILSQISTCIVQITVDDVNDQVPLFENIERMEIVENSPANTPVAAIRAIYKCFITHNYEYSFKDNHHF